MTFAKELKMLLHGFFGIIFIGDALKWTILTWPQKGHDGQDQSCQCFVYFFWKVNDIEWLEVADQNPDPDEVSICSATGDDSLASAHLRHL